MTFYVGLYVSIQSTAICVLDDAGRVEKELLAASHADDIATGLMPFAGRIELIGLEAGPMSEFLVAGLKKHGMDAILMETRRVTDRSMHLQEPILTCKKRPITEGFLLHRSDRRERR